MILVSNQYGKLDIEPLHHLRRLPVHLRLLRQLDLPVTQQSLHLEVQRYQKVHHLFVLPCCHATASGRQ